MNSTTEINEAKNNLVLELKSSRSDRTENSLSLFENLTAFSH